MNSSSRGVTNSGAGSTGGSATGAAVAVVALPATAPSACLHVPDRVVILRFRQVIDAAPPGGMPAQWTLWSAPQDCRTFLSCAWLGLPAPTAPGCVVVGATAAVGGLGADVLGADMPDILGAGAAGAV